MSKILDKMIADSRKTKAILDQIDHKPITDRAMVLGIITEYGNLKLGELYSNKHGYFKRSMIDDISKAYWIQNEEDIKIYELIFMIKNAIYEHQFYVESKRTKYKKAIFSIGIVKRFAISLCSARDPTAALQQYLHIDLYIYMNYALNHMSNPESIQKMKSNAHEVVKLLDLRANQKYTLQNIIVRLVNHTKRVFYPECMSISEYEKDILNGYKMFYCLFIEVPYEIFKSAGINGSDCLSGNCQLKTANMQETINYN